MPLIAKVLLAVAAGIVLLAYIAPFFRGKPPETYFFCARCKLSTRHDDRTIEAWRNKKARFYCQKCHKDWLATHPNAKHHDSRSHQGGGCLGAAIVGLIAASSTIAALVQLA
jgi:hypothetical protein